MSIDASKRLYEVRTLPQPAQSIDTVPAVDIVVPVYNEAATLDASVRRLRDYLAASFPLTARITIVDNASTDATYVIAYDLAKQLDGVRAIHLPEKGRGRALRSAWSMSDAEVLAYMDVDLSTDLNALLPLVAPLISGHSDVSIGTRLAGSARVLRGPKREVVSRCYNAILHTALGARFTDAQCGFKAIRADAARSLLPLVEDDGWFFDTELLVVAERSGLRIHEVPVDWVDDPDSRVEIVPTAIADLKGVARLARVPGRQLGRFAAIGVVSTLAYLVLYAALRTTMAAQLANAIALLATAVANTAVNRRVTFDVRGRRGALRHQLQGLGVFGVALAVTSGSLALLHAVSTKPARVTELVVLVVANLVATTMRFVLLRRVFHPCAGPTPRHTAPTTRDLLRGIRSLP